MEAEELYDEFLTINDERINDCLDDLVVMATDNIAEEVNNLGSLHQIVWLFAQGYSKKELKDLVSKALE